MRIELPKNTSIDPDGIFSRLNKARQSSELGQAITCKQLYYEASIKKAGLLDEVSFDGSRRSGHFIDGIFVAE